MRTRLTMVVVFFLLLSSIFTLSSSKSFSAEDEVIETNKDGLVKVNFVRKPVAELLELMSEVLKRPIVLSGNDVDKVTIDIISSKAVSKEKLVRLIITSLSKQRRYLSAVHHRGILDHYVIDHRNVQFTNIRSAEDLPKFNIAVAYVRKLNNFKLKPSLQNALNSCLRIDGTNVGRVAYDPSTRSLFIYGLADQVSTAIDMLATADPAPDKMTEYQLQISLIDKENAEELADTTLHLLDGDEGFCEWKKLKSEKIFLQSTAVDKERIKIQYRLIHDSTLTGSTLLRPNESKVLPGINHKITLTWIKR